MKRIGIISTTALFLILGATVPALAQEEHHEGDTNAPKQEQQAKPAQHEEQAKPAKQQEQAKPEERQQAQAPKQEQQAKGQQKQQQKQQQQAKVQQGQQQQKQQQQAKVQQGQQQQKQQQQQAKSAKQEEQQQAKVQQQRQGQQHAQRSATEEQRQRSAPALRLSVRSEGRIPDDRFRSNFGRDHRFRIGSPQIVGGYSRFQYGGFWFGFLQPWPEGWYYTDDVYVDYIDGGYYLCNPSYPGVQISITVVS